ncbi:MAG TPA: response regulator [Candidatus Wallbacteria bacterium]|nr:response regulator [Candidatus Wallbacteria bacterium]
MGERAEKILIVDDAQFMRYTIKKILAKFGFDNIIEAENVENALKVYQAETPDLVTMDITMPGESGIEGLKQIKQINPQARVIMVSAASQKDKVIEALTLGAKHFIVKPFTEDNLIATIDKVLKM